MDQEWQRLPAAENRSPALEEATQRALAGTAQVQHSSEQEPKEPSAPMAVGDQSSASAEVERILALPFSHSVSHGQPTDGSLAGGVELPAKGPGFIANPKRPENARFSSVQLLHPLLRAGAEVGSEEPGAPLVINDLSLRDGGPIKQHGSHQNGRDADVLFFVRDAEGRPRRSVGVPIDPAGNGVDFRDLAVSEDDVPVRLDVPRTWRLMHSLITHSGDRLQRIFIVEHVRAMLISEAQRVNASQDVQDRFAILSCQPGTPHDDHMHLRFFCTPEDMKAGCRDSGPTYPFRLQALKEIGLRPHLAGPISRPLKAAASKRKTTPEQARKKAGKMDQAVVRFLQQRESWLKKTTPPRRYCR